MPGPGPHTLRRSTRHPDHSRGKRHQGDDQKKQEKKPEVDEKAYKAALERIPEPKEKYDPWGVARPAEPAKKPK